MPRSPTVATPPPGINPQSPNTTIESADWNALVDDTYQIFNTVQPVVYGGTGAADASTARTNLGVAAATWEPCGYQSITSGTNVYFTLPTQYKLFKIYGFDINFSASTGLLMRTSTDGGVSYNQIAGDYHSSRFLFSGALSSAAGSTTGNSMAIADPGLSSAQRLMFEVTLDPGSGSQFASIMSDAKYLNTTGENTRYQVAAGRSAVGRVNAAAFLITSGAFISSRWQLLGLV